MIWFAVTASLRSVSPTIEHNSSIQYQEMFLFNCICFVLVVLVVANFICQALYVHEGIDWSQIHFEDNEHILHALTHKGEGVFPTLDSECLIPRATDRTFLNKMLSLTETSKVIVKVSRDGQNRTTSSQNV